jgi:hypothetical protein
MVPSLWWSIDYSDLARFCSAAGKHIVALQACDIGMRMHGRDPMLLVRRAQALDGLGRLESAIACCAEALRLNPEPSVTALAGAVLALALERQGSPRAALDAAAIAVAADPASVEAHCALGNVLAWHGDWERAWPELECHWLEERAEMRERFGGDEWNGESLAGRRVVAVHGQGLGDLIQMARYLPLLRARCAHLTLECPAALAPLLCDVPGLDAMVVSGATQARDVDSFVRVMSLPRLFGERVTSYRAPYLRVPLEASTRWEALRRNDSRLRVGLAWAGNPFHRRNLIRSIALDVCAPFASIPGIAWTSLQIGPNADDAIGAALPLERFDAQLCDMADTAALIGQLDLVIAVDTGVAHLAGALGATVWLMLPQRPDWRWPCSGATTPWYRSMRLFHAGPAGWPGIIADVSRTLRESLLRAQPFSADRVNKSVERSKVCDTKPRRATVSQSRDGLRTP